MRNFVFLVLMSLFVGCAPLPPRYARIDDIGSSQSDGTGYQVVAVDGTAVIRAKNKKRTAAPVAMVPEGTHKFSVNSPDAPPREFTATVEPDKEYRIALQPDGMPALVETGR